MDVLKQVLIFFLLDHVQGQASRRRLTRDLLRSYDKVTIPDGAPLNVTHTLQLKRLVSFENQVLTLDGYVLLQWKDDQLMWDPNKYDDIRMTWIPNNLVWKPDIILENNADQPNGAGVSDMNIVVSFDGFIFYTPPVKLRSYCKLDKTRSNQFSKVRCNLKFMSWTYDGLILNLEAGREEDILADFDNSFNYDWRIHSSSVERHERFYDCCLDTPYVDIEYTLVLKRS